MKVFKFGGASVKDAKGVENVVKVLQHENFTEGVVIVSAMGKMTNALEEVVNAYYKKQSILKDKIQFIRDFHYAIINELFPEKTADIYFEVEQLFGLFSGFMITNKSSDYNYIYDQLVGFGELLSTKIISAYLNQQAIKNTWLDVRTLIKTDANYRDAHVDWVKTEQNIQQKLANENIYLTQGFLGASEKNNTTSLGREGSDYSAAIFAYCLHAKSVTIWKDVDGVLNADPRYFEKSVLLKQISYSEAIEMAFYGASVIHPKTLKPLENKQITLYVRSFLNLNTEGTIVSRGQQIIPNVPCFIIKQQQILLSISALDFSFMVEYNLSDIFKILHDHKLKVNLIQNSAISFSVCIEDKYNNFQQFLLQIKTKYKVNYFENVTLYTIRHATTNTIESIVQKGEVLLKQRTQGTVQLIIK